MGINWSDDSASGNDRNCLLYVHQFTYHTVVQNAAPNNLYFAAPASEPASAADSSQFADDICDGSTGAVTGTTDVATYDGSTYTDPFFGQTYNIGCGKFINGTSISSNTDWPGSIQTQTLLGCLTACGAYGTTEFHLTPCNAVVWDSWDAPPSYSQLDPNCFMYNTVQTGNIGTGGTYAYAAKTDVPL